ncbi:amidase, partial [Salmonella enterica subsp. enterica serovar 1,4,[5],12:i:-]
WRQLDVHRAAYAAATAAYDAVLLPTVPILPPDVDALLADPALFAAENAITLRNTRIGNMLGLAALTVPTGVPSAGLMAMVGPGDERRLLR